MYNISSRSIQIFNLFCSSFWVFDHEIHDSWKLHYSIINILLFLFDDVILLVLPKDTRNAKILYSLL